MLVLTVAVGVGVAVSVLTVAVGVGVGVAVLTVAVGVDVAVLVAVGVAFCKAFTTRLVDCHPCRPQRSSYLRCRTL